MRVVVVILQSLLSYRYLFHFQTKPKRQNKTREVVKASSESRMLRKPVVLNVKQYSKEA